MWQKARLIKVVNPEEGWLLGKEFWVKVGAPVKSSGSRMYLSSSKSKPEIGSLATGMGFLSNLAANGLILNVASKCVELLDDFKEDVPIEELYP